ncbi:hypothetical protein [Gracilimonas amylolytica]|jgi:hypothetical protein|uniref:hypothetical protein n=1 Tax=Gracilimonas amylolytica TaxID=1749045 RepID=UPI000CD8D92A|nr:hypothetical protein [Gracilimonas amylolytica]
MQSSTIEKNSIAERIILISNRYGSAKEFLMKCGINNYSLITDLKYGRIKKPGSEVLAQIVLGSGCDGTWLLTGKGEMYGSISPSSDLTISEKEKMENALTLLLNFDFSESRKGISEARELEIKVAEALVRLLKKHSKLD